MANANAISRALTLAEGAGLGTVGRLTLVPEDFTAFEAYVELLWGEKIPLMHGSAFFRPHGGVFVSCYSGPVLQDFMKPLVG